jgi:hypothetical protein
MKSIMNPVAADQKLVRQACMKMDETLFHIADKIKNFAVM